MITRPDRIVEIEIAKEWLVGVSHYDPACEMVNTCPITRISPTLAGPVLEPTLQEIELGPVAPAPPEVITIHEFTIVGTHEQSLSVNTLIEPEPPPDPTDAADGPMLKLQVAGLRA